MLITADELKRMIDTKASLLIIDARSWHDYCSAHIPGAVNMDLFAFHWADTSDEGMDRFNTNLAMLLKSAGITYDKHVVFYDDITGTLAARGLWLMHYISHDNTMVLDGGLYEWRRRGYPTETEPSRPSPVQGEYVYRFNMDVLATYRYIMERIDDPNVKIVDARSREEYKGLYIRAARGGHIPNAININWEANITRDGKMKPVEQLKRVYSILDKDYGGSSDSEDGRRVEEKEMICYCQGGYRAAHAYLALRLLGVKRVRVYLGSWYEWGNRDDLPVEIS